MAHAQRSAPHPGSRSRRTKRSVSFAMFVAGLLALPRPGGADEVYLRGGGRLSGVVVDRNASSVVVDVGPGQVTVAASQVERIVAGTPALALFRERSFRLSPTDVNGWLQLGLWARDHDLLTQSRQAFEHVLSLDPGNAVANREVGHVQVDGQWMSRDESYRARGYVYFEGTWVTPQERAEALSERAAEAQARNAQIEAEARAREAEARARVAEAEARRAEAESAVPVEGIPLGVAYGYGSVPYGMYGPVIAGSYIGPYPAAGRPFHHGRPFDGTSGGPGRGGAPHCGPRPTTPHRSATSGAPPPAAPAPVPARGGFAGVVPNHR